MRHAKKRLQLGRFTSWHDATIKSLAKNMVTHQSMKTTLTRAKASKQLIEKLVTLGKKNTLFARRQAQEILGEHKLVNLLFNDIAPRFAKRNSGFTRIIGLGKRRGDDAQMVIFEFCELKKKEPKKVKAAKEIKSQNAPEEIETAEHKPVGEAKKEPKIVVKENPIDEKKPQKKFMGGLRTIFKKKSDSL
ncbi:MAG TPA: 50S ribosomal protein L17 [Candidatus Omnitrophota bacterium]|nr:50S ribosomal protein L17 [Candidatus Omnitrophota bacterium]HPT39296.1 50S ribosomal protein L17 [Candidatus Omnitrophota bacterium]